MRTRGKTVWSLRLFGVVLLPAVVLWLAGCSDGSGPSPTPTPVTATVTDTVTPTPSASPTPTLADVAKQPTREGAEEFSRYFFAVYNHAFWTADPNDLQTISDSNCKFCNSTLDRVRTVRSQQDHVEGGRITVSTAVAAPGDPRKALLVNLVLQQEAGRTLTKDGRVVATTPAAKDSRMDVAVRWVENGWRFVDAHVFSKSES